ncbi:putative Queuosine, Q, salvage protein family, partial [Teratosphaeria destructans]
MSDDEADPELLELLRQRLGINGNRTDDISRDTGVLKDAQYIYDNAIDVSIDMYSTKAAAATISRAMQEREYSTATWQQVELHPKASEGFSDLDMLNFIFTMDLLNFSFWSALPDAQRYQVEYRGRRWTGYDSLLAALRRALDEGIPITTPRFWREGNATDRELRHVFRSATDEEMPLLDERVRILREAAEVLRVSFSDPDEEADNHLVMPPQESAEPHEVHAPTETVSDLGIDNRPNDAGAGPPPDPPNDPTPQPTPPPTIPPKPDHSLPKLIHHAAHSTARLVNLLTHHFPSLNDRPTYHHRPILHALGVLSYSPPLHHRIADGLEIPPGHSWEVQLRGCSVWAVELLRREMVAQRQEQDPGPRGGCEVNAVLIDFFLYDLAKEREREGQGQGGGLPHHRTRSIWY